MYYRRNALCDPSADIESVGGYARWLCFRALPSVVTVGVILLLLSVNPARAMASSEPRLNDVESGQMLIRSADADSYRAAVLQSSTVHFDVSGMIALATLEQTFQNDTDHWVEAVYAFPLPETGAVRAMEMRIGDRRVVGKIAEKSVAKKIYNEAKKSGKKTSLVEQQRPNLFTSRVANIGPGEQVVVRLEYTQATRYAHGEFTLRFPMTITPRYVPGGPPVRLEETELDRHFEANPYLGWALPTDQVPDADAITPLLYPHRQRKGGVVNPIEITARVDAGMPLAEISSPYHQLAMTRHKNRYDIRLATGFSEMDRDFVLSWRAATGAAPQAAIFSERVDGEEYGLLMVLPPQVGLSSTSQVIPRQLIFVIDTSGSMGGVAIEQARESLQLALKQLRPEDAFNIIEFNSSHSALFSTVVPASRRNLDRALHYVGQLEAGGGTEMLGALRAALADGMSPEVSGVQQIVFITDGAVGNEQQLYEEIVAHLGNRRLFTVGIGSAPNGWFMRKAAQFGRGTHSYIGDLAEVGDKMAALFTQIASPVVTDIQINWPVSVESFPARTPDLYHGEPLLIAVKSDSQSLTGTIEVSGKIGAQQWSRQLSVASLSSTDDAGHGGVATLWARQKISSLLDERVQGRDEALVKKDVLQVALDHSLVSPYTSFIAVEEVISRPATDALQKQAVANSRPRGQSPQGYAYPRTATSARANLLLGCLALFVAMMTVVLRREEVDHVQTTAA